MDNESNKESRRDIVFKAFNTAKANSYLRCLFGDESLFYMFMEGMKFERTGLLPKDLLNDESFLSDPKKYQSSTYQ